ncbi:uncharacterized protein LOC110465643 [Mizuhopecten yessoensis]|uniref:uncharacterized protein LOC110465643 n=1 Tax=Mizuhopecten yessoensis TaxID=6573 RepID=UPI000B45CCCE|nr:uncharacterized protein LOC110465643 [Mizuhopecten yessoensis]
MGKPKKKKDFFVNPLKNKNIGWRSGQDLLAGKVIRVNEQGFENLEDYYSESDADFTQDLTANISRVTRNSKENKYNKSIAENHDAENDALPQNSRFESSQTGPMGSSQSSNMFAWLKNKNIGRRTGKDVLAGKVITKNSQGFDNIEDYFSESSDAESMFMSKSCISVGLDNTDVVSEKSDSCHSVSQVSSSVGLDNTDVVTEKSDSCHSVSQVSLSVGLDNTDVVTEKSDSCHSVSQVSISVGLDNADVVSEKSDSCHSVSQVSLSEGLDNTNVVSEKFYSCHFISQVSLSVSLNNPMLLGEV